MHRFTLSDCKSLTPQKCDSNYFEVENKRWKMNFERKNRKKKYCQSFRLWRVF